VRFFVGLHRLLHRAHLLTLLCNLGLDRGGVNGSLRLGGRHAQRLQAAPYCQLAQQSMLVLLRRQRCASHLHAHAINGQGGSRA
jgi:hypothetical protein